MIVTKNKKMAARILAGYSCHDCVLYRGVEFRRPMAVHEFGENGDISIAKAMEYINYVLERV